MSQHQQFKKHRAIVAASVLLATLLSPAAAAPARASTQAITIELPAVEDAGVIQGLPGQNFGGAPYFALHQRPAGGFDHNLIRFDLSAIPAGATIDSAELRINLREVATPLTIEVGRPTAAWDESTLTWNNQPAITWPGISQNATTTGTLSWSATALVQGWHSGALPSHGVALRGTTAGAGPVRADTRDGLAPPVLAVTYTIADDTQPRSDLGDAPDSTNNLGQTNIAYPDGTLGRFPTVFQTTPAGQPVGPRHANVIAGGYLGDYLSREVEADSGADVDGVNNILSGGPAFSNQDRGDDGWRNPGATFTNCARTTVRVRVRRPVGGVIQRMYLNTWFDGNRDGDWADNALCQPGGDGGVRQSSEWIVRDRVIDMTAIPAGSYVDLNINTEFVLNTAPNAAHWVRFTLGESPISPSPADKDGRGPLAGYQVGETEDYFQRTNEGGDNDTPGTLVLDKQVITTADPTEWIDYVTYRIRLRNVGGTRPVEARIQDVLPYPLIVYPTVSGGGIEYINVSSSTGGVTPLSAELDVIPPSGATPPQQKVTWQGTLAPDADVLLTFQVRVIALCQPNQQTMTFTNTAQARPRGGSTITDSVNFTAKCIGYSDDNIDITTEPQDDVLDDGASHNHLDGLIANQHAFTVTLGLYDLISPTTIAAQSADAVRRTVRQVTIGPNQSMPFEMPLSAASVETGTLAQPVDGSPFNPIGYCLLPEGMDVCPDPVLFPNLHGVIPITATLRPNDLGDAPDSTNHAAAPMQAYPAVPANFPTVFDPATGAVQGPRHAFPVPFHLGKRVSREAEADIGPDQDPLNNIRPAANDPDNDRGDDGTNLALWNLASCQIANVPVRVAISPAAVAWFQQQGTPAYLNIWVDGNRDGDWADFTTCNNQSAPEHIVIDQAINVVALGAGLHTIMVPTTRVPWLNNNTPSWVRITLSERVSNKTLTAPGPIAYSDGRGYAQPFRTGETEDYLFYANGDGNGGPDVDVALQGKVEKTAGPNGAASLSANAADASDVSFNFDRVTFAIEIENRGSQTASNVLVNFQKPTQLRDMEIILFKSGNEVAMEELHLNGPTVSFVIPRLLPGQSGEVVLGWYGCITCTVALSAASAEEAAAVDYTGLVTATVSGDKDSGNNTSSSTARSLRLAPIVGSFMDYTDDSCMDRIIGGPVVSNKSAHTLRGRAEPNSIIAILIGLVKVGTTTTDAQGRFSYNLTLPPGVNAVRAQYEANSALSANAAEIHRNWPPSTLLLKVDPALPINPMSLCLTNSSGRSFAFPRFGLGLTYQKIELLKPGTYTVTVQGNNDPNAQLQLKWGDIVLKLNDSDGDNTYTGQITIPAPSALSRASAESADATGTLTLFANSNGTETTFSQSVTVSDDGKVTDRSTGQPLANAEVVLLGGQPTDGDTAYAALSAAEAGQPTPQVTGADGGFSYSATDGLYRLDVQRSGFQRYRSRAIDAGSESLNKNIALTPVINAGATQVVYVTANGYQPAVVNVYAGAVIEFVNLDTEEHSAAGTAFDSGALEPGESYKVRMTAAGTFAFGEGDGNTTGAIVVASGSRVMLPLVRR